MAAAIVALFTSAFTLYKGVTYDRRLASMEVAQREIDHFAAGDAILGYTFGEPAIERIHAAARDTFDPQQSSGITSREMLMVRVPVTVKNLSKLPIAIDFNEQWTFLGQLLGPADSAQAEILNASNDAYPLSWRRSQCVVGVSADAWSNLGLDDIIVSESKAAGLRALGKAFWAERDKGLDGSPSELLKRAALRPMSATTAAQFKRLRVLVGKRPYFAHTDVGATCTLLNGGVFVATLRASEEKALQATYLVRGDQQWFSHLLRLHYRQVQPPGDEIAWYCRGGRANPLLLLEAATPASCAAGKDPPEYRFQDLRQTLFVGAPRHNGR